MSHLAELFCWEGFCWCSLRKWLQQLSVAVPLPQAAASVAGSVEGKVLVKVGQRLGWQISGCNTQDNNRSCRAAVLGQTGSLLLESLAFLVSSSMLSPNRFEGSGKTVFDTVQGVHIKSLANTLALIYPVQKW